MKTKRKLSVAQTKASKRNWHKGIISSMVSHANNMKKSRSLTFAEQMKVLKCKTILEELLEDWKPTI